MQFKDLKEYLEYLNICECCGSSRIIDCHTTGTINYFNIVSYSTFDDFISNNYFEIEVIVMPPPNDNSFTANIIINNECYDNEVIIENNLTTEFKGDIYISLGSRCENNCSLSIGEPNLIYEDGNSFKDVWRLSEQVYRGNKYQITFNYFDNHFIASDQHFNRVVDIPLTDKLMNIESISSLEYEVDRFAKSRILL